MSSQLRVLILAPFADAGLDAINGFGEAVHEDWRDTGVMWDPEELGARLAREKFDAVVIERDFLFEETFAAAENLKVAAICRAALNQIDVDAATAHGVVVLNTPGRNANAVAELTIGLMLAVARRISESERYVRGGLWQSPSDPYTALRGAELSGRTLGVVGFGAVGRRVAEICRVIGMDVIVHDPYVDSDAVEAFGASARSLDDLIRTADVITLHAPAAEDGEPLLGAGQIAAMKAGSIVINTASAELVDTDALAKALGDGRLAGAGYDIFETAPIEPSHPFLKLDNVVITPHIGGATDETIERHSRMISEDLARFAHGEMPVNMVNPDAWAGRRG
ncbi:MAG: 3-phosphoglycerate dehydrogenase [Chloroflexi bacterium]|nr:3-phosphoglycerate dehydrogenase [Chloroflexota bacterium]